MNYSISQEACTYLSDDKLAGKELIMGVAKVLGIYFNYTGHAPCFNTSQEAGSGLGDVGWSFQVYKHPKSLLNSQYYNFTKITVHTI